MQKTDFLRRMEEALELAPDSIHEKVVLQDIDGWDSLAVVVFMALADEQVGLIVSPDKINQARTVGDLLALLGDRLDA